LEMMPLDLGPPPEKDWAIVGKANRKGGQARFRHSAQGFIPSPEYPNYLSFLEALDRKIQQMKDSEVRYEAYEMGDAEVVLVAFGYAARVSREALYEARAKGFKVGLIRPIILWPFPYQAIKEKAAQGAKFVVVEDNLGQMIEDVNIAVEGQAEVHLVGALARHDPGEGGAIFPDKVLAKIEEITLKS